MWKRGNKVLARARFHCWESLLAPLREIQEEEEGISKMISGNRGFTEGWHARMIGIVRGGSEISRNSWGKFCLQVHKFRTLYC